MTLPVLESMPALRAALEANRVVILSAPPGAGKSTAVPLALRSEAWLGAQGMVMLQPRRLAARAVAMRMAASLNETVGRQVGYSVRLERRTSEHTRIEIVTEGILTRRLQADPALEGLGLVIFDEFHERSLHTDTALALTLEAQATLRPDLRVLVMSATLDTEALSAALGGAPVIESTGRSYPVELHYAARDPQDILRATANVTRQALSDHDGDALVFLPGTSEIARVQQMLGDLSATLHPLYGDLPLEAQQAAILPGSERRVVLATNIAETSLTIEGIRIVIDSGYQRVSRFEPGLGLSRLETTRITQASADQRAGRAGRISSGVCYRLWSQSTHTALLPARVPEILEADLMPLALELAAWGAHEDALTWVTRPPAAAMSIARQLLTQLGALESGRISAHGRAMHALGTHPRLAHLLLGAQELGLAGVAADLAALLEERDPLPREVGADVALRLEMLRDAHSASLKRIRQLASAYRGRLEQNQRSSGSLTQPDAYSLGKLIALAYPERIAQRREGSFERYKLSNGRGVRLPPADPLSAEPYLAVAHLDAGSDEGRIHLAAALHPADIPTQTREIIAWDSKTGALIAQRERYNGAIILGQQRVERISDAARTQALCEALRLEGLEVLGWSDSARQYQARVQSLRVWRDSEGWPELSDAALLETLEDWLGPFLGSVRKREDFARLPLLEALHGRLSWAQNQQLEQLAPSKLEVPSGSRIKLEYHPDGSAPVLAVRLQEVFGLLETPAVNQGGTPVLLHLLSPAYRPVQVTQDLRSFWQNTYPAVRKELRVRYPKHSWPEDPWTAQAVRGAKRRQ